MRWRLSPRWIARWAAACVGAGLALLGWWGWPWLQRPAPPPPASPAPTVWVVGEGRPRPVIGRDAIPANLLWAAGVRLFPGDVVRCDGQICDPTAPFPHPWAEGSVLQITRAVPFTVRLGNLETLGYTSAPTVGQAVWQVGVRWSAADRLEPAPETPRRLVGAARRVPARTITVRTPEGEMLRLRVTADRVAEALAQGGLALQGLDTTDPPPDALLPDDGVVRLVRIWEEVSFEQRPLPFDTRYQPVPDLEIDQLQVVQAGEYGLEVQRVRVRYRNGEQVDREVESRWTLRPPKPRIVGYGTKIVVRTLDTPNGPIQYWRAVRVFATSYSPCRLGTDDNRCDFITASGKPLRKGIVAVTLAWYRAMKGMLVYIPGYGVAEIADVGGGIPGRPWIDLGFSEQDYEPWAQWVTVYFLAPPPPPENILWILP